MVEQQLNEEVNEYIAQLKKWQDEIVLLRSIVNGNELTETFKWKHPCYTYNGKNVVIIQEFKHYVALLFEKGVLMKDRYESLIQQTKNVQAARQLRFESLAEIEQRKAEIEWYIGEAIRVEASGEKVPMKRTEDFDMPIELQRELVARPELKTAFEQLTPGRQRQYILHVGQAKRESTRQQRVEKYIPHILDGKGMHDK
ncbi:YdeI/OmpD-associated family protein [Staphylococcus auricularis]|uniref:YdeI/OmpD-associated family protein n=1 Tax=Staphylococcus auricularis TaxID=29379 RepID=A0AAW7MEA5_9STAP|nr:YdeI/OmpD-associated family protein [Staphylococcus auricularis]MBM0867436.1 hypothetical protein [Staphylococcus auricularis]MCG7341537.1 YdeI/OmpD-associated family protein [Staphylococcus auricularis]MDC6327704.1 YdeI/OmpD-associated family protein [Staphylococcus auricularis]MDN4533656.1 YdeI/OmpD-associated family protein [Staphylococcus auricularis]HJE01185.1 YdeI/OmpD-associated family protein [Staphylococcus auricularis]